MTHPEWCGENCSNCTKYCKLDEQIPCSPNCCNFDKNGNPQYLLCKDCDSYQMNYVSLNSLDKEALIRLIELYDNYIQVNAEENPEFGHSWFPVSIHEYLNNEYLMEKDCE